MEKINLVELLKYCPKGMELDCLLFSDPVTYNGLDGSVYPIKILTQNNGSVSLTKEGYLFTMPNSKCIIFPKGKTTWKGFVPPCKFKDGDICYIKTRDYEHIFIFKTDKNYTHIHAYVNLIEDRVYTLGYPICNINSVKEIRLATKKERTKLFNAIKNNGYCWNSETKTLEKVFPYNIGTKVWVKSDKEHEYIHTIVGISHNCLGNLEYEVKEEKTGIIVHYPTELLIPITTKEPKFKVGDKVRYKNNHNVVFTITSIEEDTYVCGTKAAFWFEDQDKLELVPNKFDITTLKPFDKVLVRDHDRAYWDITFYECYDKTNKSYPYRALGGTVYKQCIPYKDNEDLAGFVKECSDYYKTWINEENEFN